MNETETTEIYTYGHTLSLHEVLPIFAGGRSADADGGHRHRFRDRIGQSLVRSLYHQREGARLGHRAGVRRYALGFRGVPALGAEAHDQIGRAHVLNSSH